VAGYFQAPQYQFNETPEEWRKFFLGPWRILFPDLEWASPERDL
jgi:hypothetical protein